MLPVAKERRRRNNKGMDFHLPGERFDTDSID